VTPAAMRFRTAVNMFVSPLVGHLLI